MKFMYSLLGTPRGRLGPCFSPTPIHEASLERDYLDKLRRTKNDNLCADLRHTRYETLLSSLPQFFIVAVWTMFRVQSIIDR